MMGRDWFLAGMLLAPFPAAAETVYVIDKLQISLRAERDGAGMKPLETGAALEVLQRDERFVRVRDKTGDEGWIEARYVSPEPSARAQLTKLQEELNKTRAQLAEAQAKPDKVMPAAASDSGIAIALDYIWLLVGLGLLAVGFAAGILWHRESIRRRMGGMYLRI